MKVHFLLCGVTLFLSELEAKGNYSHQCQTTFGRLCHCSTHSVGTGGLRTVNLAHLMSNKIHTTI